MTETVLLELQLSRISDGTWAVFLNCHCGALQVTPRYRTKADILPEYRRIRDLFKLGDSRSSLIMHVARFAAAHIPKPSPAQLPPGG